MHAAAPHDLNRVFAEALTERLRRHDRLEMHAKQLHDGAAGDPRWLGRALLLRGYSARFLGQAEQAEALASEALAMLAAAADPAGCAACRDLIAGCLSSRGRFHEALAELAPILELPESARLPIEWFVTHAQLGIIHGRLGNFDEALRWYYRAIATARATGDAACQALALGGLGGYQLSLQNMDDAASSLDAAWALMGEQGKEWIHIWSVVALNRLMVLAQQKRFDEALPLAELVQLAEPGMSAVSRHKRKLLLAITCAQAGQFERAQQFLDEGLALCRQDAAPPPEWVWVQAHLWNHAGKHTQALQICEAHFDAAEQGRLAEAASPDDLVRLHTEMTLAHEALGQHAQALRSQRAMTDAERELVSAATRARRMTLQIQYELDSAQRDRDEALRRELEGAREQARLSDMNVALEAANNAKTRFLAAASHDLRQPVQALAMYMAALKTERGPGPPDSLVNRMDQSLHALSTMFDVLLDVSRLDAGLVSTNLETVRLKPLLHRLVDEFELRAAERLLKLRLHLPANLRAQQRDFATRSDAVLLERCLRNLIDNALKYTDRGGVVMRLKALANGPPRWRVEVKDTGAGIAAELQSQVFEEFFQVGNPERDRSKGLGLGLSIVRRMSVLLAHPLGLRSSPGRGCCFHLDVPRIEVEAPDTSGATDRETTLTAMGLIVIDDDAMVRDSLSTLLQHWGHRVIQGADAQEVLACWEQASRPRLDAAVVDLRLREGRTGLEAIAQLRHRLGSKLPALVITGDIAPQRLKQLTEAAQPWLPKPLMPMRLRSWLSSLA